MKEFFKNIENYSYKFNSNNNRAVNKVEKQFNYIIYKKLQSL